MKSASFPATPDELTDPNPGPNDIPDETSRHLPLLLVLFVGSGCSALIYEIVWFQLLQLVIGSSAISLGVLLGTFMGGMCLGSLLLPRLLSPKHHPLRVYALLEIGIGILGIALLLGMPYVDRFYTSSFGHGFSALLLRGGVSALCLLPPTLLMGATLPVVARWVETTPRGISWLGFFYGGNIVGAVIGCLLAGFYLLRVYDVEIATYVAATINGLVALTGFFAAILVPFRSSLKSPKERLASSPLSNPAVYFTIAFSGLCALGAEVIWTRLLSLMLGATVYTFSIILAVFLAGLGIGSSIGSLLARLSLRPRRALGVCQLLLTASIAWTAYMLDRSLPYWPVDPTLSTSPWFNFQLDLVRCVWAVLPATILWGASFPLALAAVAARGQDPGRLVGGVYAANTVGAILGAVGCSIVLIGWVGTQQSQRILIGLSALAALLMLKPLRRSDPVSDIEPRKRRFKLWGVVRFAVLAGLSGLLAWRVPAVPWEVIGYGRNLVTDAGMALMLYKGEGMNASIAVSDDIEGPRNFHVTGKIVASSESFDMRLQRLLGHLPALLHPKPRSVLVVGCGAGVTAGTFVIHPDIERIVICEIEPLIPPAAAEFFGRENHDVINDPRVELVYDDGRHYILTTQEKFDIITSDPIHPWVKGAATLYSKEYFELCRKHLNPGGMVTQWVPLYESNPEAVKSEIKTFMSVFPEGTIWGNTIGGEGYDLVLLGQAGATRINVDALQARLEQSDYSLVLDSLNEVKLGSAKRLLAIYAGQGPDLEGWLADADINRDRNLRLQYLAGLGLNLDQSKIIYADLLKHREFPDGLFEGSEESINLLRMILSKSPSGK